MPRGAHNEARGGKLATLAILFLLLVVGFGVGLLAGATYEDPKLVVEHLAGRTESVPLEAPAPAPGALRSPAAPEAVAGTQPGAQREAQPAPAPAHALEASAALEPLAAPAPGELPAASASGRFAVQVGAFDDENAARELVRELLALGLPVYLERESGRAPFRVRVGRFATRVEAEQIAHRLKREQRLPTWVLTQER